MKKYIISTVAFLGVSALVASVAIFSSAQVNAQEATPDANTAGQALEIAPPVVNLSANPGQTVTAQISLRDVSDSQLLVTNQINDFVAGGEDGTPKILMEDETEPNPYSMKDWISPLAQLTLEPRQIEQLPITIKVPTDAAPGGYYGVIRFTATAPEMDQTGVSLSASLGALVLLTVKGDVKEDMIIEDFFVSKEGNSGSIFESTPIQFVERLKNNGNIHEQPRGQVVITDMFGNTVAAVNINLPPRNILPNSVRKFEQSLDKSVIGDKKLFGKYNATLTVTYGNKKQTITADTSFWVVPYQLIAIVVVALIVGFFVLRFLIGRYNQRIINKATKNKKKPRR